MLPREWRELTFAANPRTQRQTDVRRHLAEQARRFGDLTDAQRDAWNAAAATYRSHRRIFLRASTMVSGFESLPREFRARVPAA
ncbi:MAG: hypothetical protein ACLQU3_31110 [Limisphaerales bacterium]